MNEFTKEELQIMHKAMQIYICDFECYKQYSITKNKLKSMIDNYCEHCESEANHNYDVNQCKKCEKLFI